MQEWGEQGPQKGCWDLPKGLRAEVEEIGRVGNLHSLQAVLLKEGAQNEVPGEGSRLRHFFPGGERHMQTDARNCAHRVSRSHPTPILAHPVFLC